MKAPCTIISTLFESIYSFISLFPRLAFDNQSLSRCVARVSVL